MELEFDVLLNPFGVLYNPASIYSSIKRLFGYPIYRKGYHHG